MKLKSFKGNIDFLYTAICAALTDAIDDVNYILNGNK